MIEHSRRHGRFDPRYPLRPSPAISTSTTVNGATREVPGFVGEAESLEQAQPSAAPEAAVQTWEGAGGAGEQGITEAMRPIDEDAPRSFEVYLGSFNGASYGVCWQGARLVYESFEPGYQRRQQLLLSPSQAQWHRFWRSMDQLGVWAWAEWYEPGERFEPKSVVRDGTYWSLTLTHADRAVESSGDNAGPDARDLDDSFVFARFCEAVARLTGGYEFA